MTQPAAPTTGDTAGATPPANPTPPAPGVAPAAATGTTPPAATETADKPLGPNGEKALAAEREERKKLEQQLAQLAPLQKIAAALGGGDADKGKTEIEQQAERLAAMEKTIADERTARWRAEVANDKGLTAEQAARLIGTTKEELLADADAFVALFPAGTAPKPRTPAPDLSQGARGTSVDIDARIAEAMKNGHVAQALSLQNEKLRTAK